MYEVVLILFAGLALYSMHPSGLDLKVYREGAQALLNDPPSLYSPILGPVGNPGLPFTYPPFAALVFVPLAVMPFWAALAVMTIASIVITYVVARDLAGRMGARWPATRAVITPLSLTAMCLITGPFRDSIGYGQVNILIMGACYLALVRAPRSPVLFGVAVGVCAGVKLTPLALLLLPVALLSWSTIGVAVLTFLGTQLVGLVVAGKLTISFWTNVIWDPSRIGHIDYLDNLSLQGTFERFDVPRLVWVLTIAVVGGLFVVLLRRVRATSDEAILVGLAATCMLLVSPITWSHHWVWLPVVAYSWLSLAQALPIHARRVATFLTATQIILLGISIKLLVAAAGTNPDGNLPSWVDYVAGAPATISVILAGIIAFGHVTKRIGIDSSTPAQQFPIPDHRPAGGPAR